MNSKKDHVSQYIKFLETTISTLTDTISSLLKDRAETDSDERPTRVSSSFQWYEKIPFEKTLCWVSNTHKNPVEGYTMRVITCYHKGYKYPFYSGDDETWRYAVPLTNEEML